VKRAELAEPNGLGPDDALIALALQRDVPVETIERLVALRERALAKQAEQAYNAAFAAFQAECPPVPKTSRAEIATRQGSKYGYSYAELDEIADTVRPHLTKHGLSFNWDCRVSDDGARMTATCRLRHIGGHGDSAEFPIPTASSSAMSDQQRYAAALTFAKRQSLISVLGLVTTGATPDAPGDLTPISSEQFMTLAALIQEVGADLGKFLRYAKVSRLEDIPAGRYGSLVAALEQKRKAGPR